MASRHPRLVAFYSQLLRRRFLVVGALSVVMAVLYGRGGLVTFDSKRFHLAGLRMLSPDWANTFADSYIQEGPLVIFVFGLLGRLSQISGIDPKFLLALIVEVGFTLGLMHTVKNLLADRGRSQPDVELYVGLLSIFGFVSWNAFGSGHIAEGVIPLLWLQSVRDLKKGNEVRAGILIGLSAALKTWGILGMFLVLFASPLRRSLRTVGPAVAASVLPWVPFLAFGTLATFQLEWSVQAPSLVKYVVPIGTPVPWFWRFLQAAAAMAFGAAMIHTIRRFADGPWIAASAMVALRLVLDPTYYYYYIVPLSVLCLVGAAVVFPDTPVPLRVLKVAAGYLVLHPFFVLQDEGLALWSLGLSLVFMAAALVHRRRADQSLICAF